MTGIRKAYPGVVALDGVDLEVAAGEVHVLLGENGAGKSTLMGVLGGAVPRDAGAIAIDGRPAALDTPRAARDAGIAVIHQELMLVPGLSVAENIALGRMPRRRGLVDRAAMARTATAALARLGVTLDPWRTVASLRLAERQLVEIARALSQDARIVVMDEPTSALTERETARLFEVIRALVRAGVSVVYISHRMEEIVAIGDRVTVLRDGRHVATCAVAEADPAALVRLMTDRAPPDGAAAAATAGAVQDVPDPPAPRRERLRVEGLRRDGLLHDVGFAVAAGEVLGVAGLLGAGRTELLRAVFGADRRDGGVIRVDGDEVAVRSPRDAIAAGIGLVTEDRTHLGLVPERSVRDNIALAALPRLGRAGVLRAAEERALAERHVRALRIRTPSVEQPVRTLSGGNQQKVILARWLAVGVRVLLLDEPTRGVDVAAKQELHALVRQLAADGVAVVLVSSDLPELLALADRVLVLRDGRVAATLARGEATPARVVAHAVGH
jgi:ribose transport system ATP-binding protein